jgi:hypothetical protein
MSQLSEQAQNLLQLIPESGSIGNVTLRKKFYGPAGLNILGAQDKGQTLDFAAAKTELLNNGIIKLGRGKGGSVRRAVLGLEYTPIQSPETGQVETLEVAATEEF